MASPTWLSSNLLSASCLILLLSATGCSGDPSKLPVDGVISHRGRDGGPKRSQIIAAINTSDPATVRQLAQSLASHYGYDRVLVNFYDEPAVVARFNGSGMMLDESSWIGEVTIDAADGRVSFKPSPFTD